MKTFATNKRMKNRRTASTGRPHPRALLDMSRKTAVVLLSAVMCCCLSFPTALAFGSNAKPLAIGGKAPDDIVAQADDAHPDVIEVVSDEGSKVRYHVTSGNTVEFGTGQSPSKDYTTIDYSYTGTITIPETIESEGVEYTVTGIANDALAPYYVSLTRHPCRVSRVIIPETVTRIGDSSFSYTSSLRRISIPDSVTSIGTSAFSNSAVSSVEFSGNPTISSIPDRCFSYTNIDDIDFIPASVTALGNYVFSGSALRSAVVPAQITQMGRGTFASCERLTHAEFAGTPPDREIPAHTFSGCTSLSTFDFSHDISSIEMYAFANTGFSNVTIPCSITYLGDYAFAKCSRLFTFTFEEGHEMLDVPEGLFSECKRLTTVELPATIRTIGTKAFSTCTALESISLPPSLRTLGDFAFEECTSLKLVQFEGNATYVASSTSTFYKANALESVVFLGKKATTLVYPSAMPTIYYTVSYYLSTDAVGVEEPYARHIVAANAIPAQATDAQTFDGAYLETAPSGAAWAYADGFGPTGEIVDSYFAYVPGFTRELDVGDTFVANTVEGVPVTYTVTAKPDGTQPGTATAGWSTETGNQPAIDLNTTGAVTLPQNVIGSDGNTYEVASIEGYSFLNCRRIVSVTIPATVKSIGPRAFSRCSQLRNVYFESDAQTIIDDGIFAGCGGIARVIFGGKKANLSFGTSSPDIYYTVLYFESRHDRDIDNRQSTLVVHERTRLGNLKKAEIYSGFVPSLKPSFNWTYEDGFGADIPLTDSTKVYAAGIGFQHQIQVIGGNVERTDCWFKALTFDEETGTGTCMVGLGVDGICAVHTGVSGMPVIPQAVTDEDGNVYTVTEVSDYAFGSESNWLACHYIESISLPATVESIGTGAFTSCELMQRVTIPAGVKSMGATAFKGCEALQNVVFANGIQLDAIPASCFEGDTRISTIRLPEGVRSIGEAAFKDCYFESQQDKRGLTSVSLPSTLESIGDEAFYGDGLIGSIDIPASCTHVGADAYRGCYNVGLIRFNGNASRTTFGSGAFDLRWAQKENKLGALIFMDKKSTTAADYIQVADDWGDPMPLPDTYYCIRFYNSQEDFDAGNVKQRLVVKDNVAAIHYTDGFYSGSYPTPAEGSTWRGEPGFAVNKRTSDSYYALLGRDISFATVSVKPADYYYTGDYITPEPQVTWGDGTLLLQGVDYQLDTSKGQMNNGYTNNRHGPEARVFVQGIGDYAGSAFGTFSISLKTEKMAQEEAEEAEKKGGDDECDGKDDEGDGKDDGGDDEGDGGDDKDDEGGETFFKPEIAQKMLYVYDGTPKTPEIAVSAQLDGNAYDAVEGADYTVEYRDNVNAGIGQVIVRGKGPFAGEHAITFTINPMSIMMCTVTGLNSTYKLVDGYVNPTVSLANPSGTSLVEGVDFEVSYSNNTSLGIGTMRIIGIGNYTGVMSKSFTIVGAGGGKKGPDNGDGGGGGGRENGDKPGQNGGGKTTRPSSNVNSRPTTSAHTNVQSTNPADRPITASERVVDNGGDFAPNAQAADATDAADAAEAADGSPSYNVFRIGSQQPDLVTAVENWWWIALLLGVAIIMAIGAFNQKRYFAKQLPNTRTPLRK